MRGRFEVEGCNLGQNRDFSDPETEFNFDPTNYTTRRFENVLEIWLQDEAVDFIESDVLLIRVPRVDDLRAIEQRPIVLPVSFNRQDVNATLSLYSTCPHNTHLQGITGVIEFEKFTIGENTTDTGSQEVIEGTLTATVTDADRARTVGFIHAEFFFLPSSISPNIVFE